MSAFEIWPCSPKSFLADTRDMGAGETGAYARLLMHLWLNRKLPADDRALGRIAGLQGAVWRRCRANLAPLFYDTDAPTGWRHHRIDKDRAAADRYHQQKKTAARARWPVDIGDGKNPLRSVSAAGAKSLKTNGATHAAGMRSQSHLRSKTITNPSVSAGLPAVENSAQTAAAVVCGNSNPPTPTYQRAQQDLLGALLSTLRQVSPSAAKVYAHFIELFTADPDLLDAATNVQLLTGKGALWLMLEVKRREIPGEVH